MERKTKMKYLQYYSTYSKHWEYVINTLNCQGIMTITKKKNPHLTLEKILSEVIKGDKETLTRYNACYPGNKFRLI